MPQPHPFNLCSITSAAMAANSGSAVPSAAGAGGGETSTSLKYSSSSAPRSTRFAADSVSADGD